MIEQTINVPAHLSRIAADLHGRKDATHAAYLAVSSKQTSGLICQGTRGSGRSALLATAAQIGHEQGLPMVAIRAEPGVPLAPLLLPAITPQLGTPGLMEVPPGRSALAAECLSAAFDPAFSSGRHESVLGRLLAQAIQARVQDRPLLLCVDDAHWLHQADWHSLLLALQYCRHSAGAPLVLVCTALPGTLIVRGRLAAFVRQVVKHSALPALEQRPAAAWLMSAAAAAGRKFEAGALATLLEWAGGVPRYLHELAKLCSSPAPATGGLDLSTTLRAPEAERLMARASAGLEKSYWRAPLLRLAPAEWRYLRALAELGEGPQTSGAVAARLCRPVTSIAPTRAALLAKQVIFAPGYGRTQLAMPKWSDFLLRALPQLPSAASMAAPSDSGVSLGA